MSSEQKLTEKTDITPRLTSLLGKTPILPGESEEHYQQGLQSVIEELEAKTVLQVYLAEKIFECLWWMRRFEQQKRATIAREMARIINRETHSGPPGRGVYLDIVHDMQRILDPQSHEEFKEILEIYEQTEQALLQEAFDNKSEDIAAYNNQITVLAKNLAGFQASYEVLTNRKLNTERLRLQNELLQRDLDAIEIEALPDASQPPKTGR